MPALHRVGRAGREPVFERGAAGQDRVNVQVQGLRRGASVYGDYDGAFGVLAGISIKLLVVVREQAGGAAGAEGGDLVAGMAKSLVVCDQACVFVALGVGTPVVRVLAAPKAGFITVVYGWSARVGEL